VFQHRTAGQRSRCIQEEVLRPAETIKFFRGLPRFTAHAQSVQNCTVRPSGCQQRQFCTVRAAECCCQHSAPTATVSLFPELHGASNPLYLRLRRLSTVNTVPVPCPTVTTLLMSCSRQRRTALHQPILACLLQGAATLRSAGVGRIFEGCFEQVVPASPLRHHFPRELTTLAACRC